MFLSVLTIGESGCQPPRVGTYKPGSGWWVGFFVLGTKAAWTRPLSDLRVQVYIPKTGICEVQYKRFKDFKRWFNMSAIV